MKKRHSVVAGLLFVLVFMTMFSRNYLGVHTPQDVLVGLISTAVMMYLTGWLELWSEKDKKRDLMILVAGLLICIAAVLYYEYKPYPLDYLPDGSFWLILLKCGEMHMKESDLLHPLSSAGYWKKDN